MERLDGARQTYAWGSTSAIPEILGVPADERPWAEQWFGAHPGGPTRLASGRTLESLIDSAPERLLGEDVVRRFGPQLPFLLKLIAPAQALSLQVHPSLEQAGEGYARENRAGLAPDAPERNYKDSNHKPEMVLAIETFEAVAGFRAPRRVGEVLAGLDSPLARRMRRTLRLNPTRFGIRQVFSDLVEPATRPSGDEVAGESARTEIITEVEGQDASEVPTAQSPEAESGAEQAVRPTIRFIAARNTILSPALLNGGSTSKLPSSWIGTFMKQLKATGIMSSVTPCGASAAARLPKQPRCNGLSG